MIKISIDVNVKGLGALEKLATALLGAGIPTMVPDENPAPTEEAPTEEAPTEEAPTEEAPTEEAPTEEAPTEEAPTEEAPTEEAPITDITREQLRALTREAIAADKEAVMAILAEIGAKNVSSLEEKDFQTYHDKIKELV